MKIYGENKHDNPEDPLFWLGHEVAEEEPQWILWEDFDPEEEEIEDWLDDRREW